MTNGEARRRAEERMNRGCALLKQGRFADGWAEYEHRFAARGGLRELPQPLWRGEPLAGKRLYVHREQGIGDELLYASCFPELIDRCQALVASCDRRLAPLFERSMPTAIFLPGKPGADDWEQGTMLAVDYQSPAGNIPRYRRRNRQAFPDRRGFLTADPHRVDSWRRRFAALGDGPKVGISWLGGMDLLTLRKAPWELWRQLFATPGCSFVSLQHGDTQAQLAAFREWGVPVYTFAEVDPLADLDGLAAQMAALDLVLTVPNANVHLAGALGLPVWVLFTPAFGCWWIVDDVDSPWYPTARIFTKGREQSWDSLLDLLLKALAAQHL